MTVFLAASSAAQDVRMARVGKVVEISGGGASPWTLSYGTFDPPRSSVGGWAGATAIGSANGRAFFGHGLWLREIDAAAGTVVGRWRFPCPIVSVAPTADRVHLRLDCGDGSRKSTTEWDFDPRAPQVPAGSWGGLLALRLPETEVAYLLTLNYMCRPAQSAAAFDRAAAVPRVEDMVRRDPLSPWIRVALATATKAADPARAAALLNDAVAMRSDWVELFRMSACLERAGDREPARRAYERAYQSFLAEGNDPRMLIVLISRLILYGPATERATPEDVIERMYRVSPWTEGADMAWRLHADDLERAGQHELSQTWRTRADDAESNSLYLFGVWQARRLDFGLLVASGACVAALLLLIARTIQYNPQRRLARGFFTIGYWSRQERLSLLLAVFVGWYAFGLASVYGRMWLNQASIPIGIATGSFADLPEGPSYFERSLGPSPERDLLVAISRQQHRDPVRAEALYRSLPQFAEAWNNLGVILSETGRPQEAQQAFARAIQIDPTLAEAVWNAGKGSPSLWTTLHQQYVLEQKMIAPPRRWQMERAFLGVSVPGLFARAFAGPLVNIWYVRQGAVDPLAPPYAAAAVFEIGNRTPPLVLIPIGVFLTGLLAVAVCLRRVRDVTQPPGRAFAILEYLLPGVSPRWRVAGGFLLLLWSLFLLTTVLNVLNGTPFALASFAVIPTDAFGVHRSGGTVAHIQALFTPRPIWFWGSAALISIANAVLVWRWHRARR